MTDNIYVVNGDTTGVSVATDDVGGVQVQRLKISLADTGDPALHDVAPGQAQKPWSLPVTLASNYPLLSIRLAKGRYEHFSATYPKGITGTTEIMVSTPSGDNAFYPTADDYRLLYVPVENPVGDNPSGVPRHWTFPVLHYQEAMLFVRSPVMLENGFQLYAGTDQVGVVQGGTAGYPLLTDTAQGPATAQKWNGCTVGFIARNPGEGVAFNQNDFTTGTSPRLYVAPALRSPWTSLILEYRPKLDEGGPSIEFWLYRR